MKKSSLLITGQRKGLAPEGKWEYDVLIDGVEKIVVASSEAEALKEAKAKKFVTVKEKKGKKKKK